MGLCPTVLGHLAEILPSGCPSSAGLLAGISWEKCQSPRYTRGMGGCGYND